jgi:hypothetical protein
MNKFKIIAIFLVVLFGIFVINGIILGAMMFFYLIKYVIYASVISLFIYLYVKTKNK